MRLSVRLPFFLFQFVFIKPAGESKLVVAPVSSFSGTLGTVMIKCRNPIGKGDDKMPKSRLKRIFFYAADTINIPGRGIQVRTM